MIKYYVKEYVSGCYYYEVNIDEKIIQNLNEYLENEIVNFIPLTETDIAALLGNDQTHPRYNETYVGYRNAYSFMLREAVRDWMDEEAWYHEIENDIETVNVERKVKKEI